MLDIDRVTECCAIFLKQSCVPLTAKLIECSALCGFPRQADLVGLPVDRHHRPDNIRQDRGRHGARSEVRARPACGTHRTTDNQLTTLDEASGILNACCNLVVDRENAIDGQTVGARAHERSIRAGAEQQLETRQHHRLTRTGLTGDDDKALTKVNVCRLDDTEMRNIERLDHRGPSLHPRTGRLNLRTSRAENGVSSTRTS